MDMDKIDATPMGLSPGDVLVLRPAEPLTREVAEKLAAHVSGLLPDIKVLVTDPGLTVTPMRFRAGDVCVVSSADPITAEAAARVKASVSAAIGSGVNVIVMDSGFALSLPALPAVTYHVTEDGEPWAVYREGAHPVECLTRQDVIDAMNGYGSGDGDDWAADNPELPAVTVFHLSSIEPESTRSKKRRRDDDDDDMLSDERLWFCDADDPGAYPVTGLKLG